MKVIGGIGVIIAIVLMIIATSWLIFKTFHDLKHIEKFNNPLITFIIPSIGRPTLGRTLLSLHNQINPNWLAIVVFDGIDNAHEVVKDDRIVYLHVPKLGKLNFGGLVRNHGIKAASTSWIAFIDDDDTVAPTYVQAFYNINNAKQNVNCIVFKMIYMDGKVLPPYGSSTISEGLVGISFAMERSLLDEGFGFNPGPTEDFDLLNRLGLAGKQIYLSDSIEYNVGF